jgi:hypothetical protein
MTLTEPDGAAVYRPALEPTLANKRARNTITM